MLNGNDLHLTSLDLSYNVLCLYFHLSALFFSLGHSLCQTPLCHLLSQSAPEPASGHSLPVKVDLSYSSVKYDSCLVSPWLLDIPCMCNCQHSSS